MDEFEEVNGQLQGDQKRRLEISYNKAQKRVDDTNKELLKLSSALLVSQTDISKE